MHAADSDPAGPGIEERDGQGTVAVVSDLLARTYFGEKDPIGWHLTLGN